MCFEEICPQILQVSMSLVFFLVQPIENRKHKSAKIMREMFLLETLANKKTLTSDKKKTPLTLSENHDEHYVSLAYSLQKKSAKVVRFWGMV